MSWHKWLQSFSNDKEVIKTKNMPIHNTIPFVDTKIKGYKERLYLCNFLILLKIIVKSAVIKYNK